MLQAECVMAARVKRPHDDGNGAASIAAMTAQLDNMQATLARLEKKIDTEIAELKTEQIAQLRAENTRLADDQRRMWEALRNLENDRSAERGSKRAINSLTHTVSGLFGGAFGAFATWWFTSPKH